jgi:NADP-dependent aldehyde dehydrogenase
MGITGELMVGSDFRRGMAGTFEVINPNTGEGLAPAFGSASPQDVDDACALAWQAFEGYRALPLAQRAGFLDSIARHIIGLGEELIDRCIAETGLLRGRIEGERGRTVAQLQMFAAVVRQGDFLEVRIDPALPDRKPQPRVDLRLQNIPLGPVAVFGASNFPLAFSVAGGDTAAAFAAGCSVIVKAHPAHPGTSELVGRAIRQAAADTGMPAGVFSLLFDSGIAVGQRLVADHRIRAVGFTGSRTGGTALVKIAAARPVPIPVYAEMSSINPVIILPGALAARGAQIGQAFVAALTLGAGQFCTNPGLVMLIEGEGLDAFTAAVAATLAGEPAATMLTPQILSNYSSRVQRRLADTRVRTLAQGRPGSRFQGQAAVFVTQVDEFIAARELHEEVFGASSLIVSCPDLPSLRAAIAHLDGQLTAAIHFEDSDHDAVRALLPPLELTVGRVIANGFGTGVEVGHAMVHGGPYPATSDGRSTSVGSLAIARFLRPVSYQNLPDSLLPESLRTGNPLQLTRRLNGTLNIGADPTVVSQRPS